jgi:hypothetical protein
MQTTLVVAALALTGEHVATSAPRHDTTHVSLRFDLGEVSRASIVAVLVRVIGPPTCSDSFRTEWDGHGRIEVYDLSTRTRNSTIVELESPATETCAPSPTTGEQWILPDWILEP